MNSGVLRTLWKADEGKTYMWTDVSIINFDGTMRDI